MAAAALRGAAAKWPRCSRRIAGERRPDAHLRCRRAAASIDSWARPARPTNCAIRRRELDQGSRRGRSTAASMHWSAPDRSTIIVEPAIDRLAAWPEAVDARGRAARRHRRSAMRPTSRRSFGRASRSTAMSADHRQRPRLHPHRARPARGSLGAMVVAILLRLAVAVPRPDHRPAAAPAGPRRASRPARPGARGQGPAAALAQRRDRPARPGGLGHEPVAAPADRRDRSVRRRRHP